MPCVGNYENNDEQGENCFPYTSVGSSDSIDFNVADPSQERRGVAG